MARKAGELKKRCWLAKQRLKMGYWDSLKQENTDYTADAISPRSQMTVASLQMRNNIVSRMPSAADERMYKKVCDILDSNEVTTNPIGQLIERDVYDSLDASGKQRYVLELSDKFRELQDRYYRERTGA